MKPVVMSSLLLAIALLATAWNYQGWKTAKTNFASNNSRLEECQRLADQFQTIVRTPGVTPVVASDMDQGIAGILGELGHGAGGSIVPETTTREIEGTSIVLHDAKINTGGSYGLEALVGLVRQSEEAGVSPLAIVLQSAGNTSGGSSDRWKLAQFRFVYAADASVQ